MKHTRGSWFVPPSPKKKAQPLRRSAHLAIPHIKPFFEKLAIFCKCSLNLDSTYFIASWTDLGRDQHSSSHVMVLLVRRPMKVSWAVGADGVDFEGEFHV